MVEQRAPMKSGMIDTLWTLSIPGSAIETSAWRAWFQAAISLSRELIGGVVLHG
jgi:hypothetical protein